VLDRATGNFYVGLSNNNGATGAIMVLPRYNGYGDPTSSIVVEQADLPSTDSNGIEFLTLSTQPCSTKPVLVTVASASGSLLQDEVLAYSSNFATNDKKATGINLKDAAGNVTSGIVALAASANYAYAAVKPSGGSYFGQTNSGLAAAKITNNINIGGSLILTQTNAQSATPATGISKQIDPSINELKILVNPTINSPTGTNPSAVLTWDEPLQRLYIGIGQITTDNSAGAGARSIIVANSQTNGVVNFASIAPTGVFLAGGANEIVGVINNTDYRTLGVKN
jgi:hypothetical protein